MKPKRFFTLALVLFIFSSTGCYSKPTSKAVNFKQFYAQVIGFSKDDEKMKPIPEESSLMLEDEDYIKFKDKYFTSRSLKVNEPDKEKAVLFLQFPSDGTEVTTYKIKSIAADDKKLNVTLTKGPSAMVHPTKDFIGKFYWVMLIELDKDALYKDMKVSLKITSVSD